MKRLTSLKLAAAVALALTGHTAQAITFVYGKIGYKPPIENIEGERDTARKPFDYKPPIENDMRKAGGDPQAAGKIKFNEYRLPSEEEAQLSRARQAVEAQLARIRAIDAQFAKIKFNEYKPPIENDAVELVARKAGGRQDEFL